MHWYRMVMTGLWMGIAACAGAAHAAEGAQAPAAASALLPAKAFFGRRAIDSATLSPSGRWLAVMVPANRSERNALAVFDLQGTGQGRVVLGFSNIDIDGVHWVNDERLVFSVIDRDEGSGERSFWPGLFSVKRDGSEMRQLVNVEFNVLTESSHIVDRRLPYWHQLLHVPSGNGDEVIVGEWLFTKIGDLDAVLPKRLNVVTGQVTSIAQGAPEHVTEWKFQADGTPRVAVSEYQGRVRTHWRAGGQDTWTQIGAFDRYQAPWHASEVDSAGQLYVTAGRGKASESVLSRFDFASGKPQGQPLISTPGFDFNGSLVSEHDGGRALGVRTTTDAETTVWFEPRLKAAQADIDRRLPGRINQLSCSRCDSADMTVLVRSWSDTNPGEFWIWRGQPELWRKVATVRSGIDPLRMGTLDLHRIKARDGRDLPVWVTTPPGSKPGQKLPAVVLLHGGPWLRGIKWEWNAQAQFLASRGYLVIEPEFRGSKGYGFDHYEAGFKQWGLAMQDDVADATLWAAQKAGADPARICIAGASYGGYSTLMGLVRNPELYRCGVAWVAVTDPRLMFNGPWQNDVSEEGRRYSYPVLIGDPVADAALLTAAAPVEHAERIKAPLLLAFGDLDRRVPLEHGTRLRDAMRKAGLNPQWVVYSGEGHSWQREETHLDFEQRVERFLAQHLR